MNTRNVNGKIVAQEPSERYAMKESAFRASRSPDFPEIRRSAYTNSEHLTVPQVYDLFRYVCDAAGRSTGTLLPPPTCRRMRITCMWPLTVMRIRWRYGWLTAGRWRQAMK